MKRLVMIFFMWAGIVGSAVAGPPVYDYVPEPSGMDFSTAPKPHMPVPGGEWHAVSGDGTIYPDIINYCDPKTSPECLGHIYVACWAWSVFAQSETYKYRLAPICKDADVNFTSSHLAIMDETKANLRPSVLYYYKLDKWKPDEMGYYYFRDDYPPESLADIPFKKNTDPKEWRGEWSIDIYYGQCRPDDDCLVNGGYRGKPLVEADKSCPLTYCRDYGFDETEDAAAFNEFDFFIYPQASIVFPSRLYSTVEDHLYYNYIYKNFMTMSSMSYYAPQAPARWLPGHLDSAWLPLGVDYPDQTEKYAKEEYTGSLEDAEARLFNNILDENGNILIDKNGYYEINRDAFQAIEDINDKRFSCIKTEIRVANILPPSYQLNALLNSYLASVFPSKSPYQYGDEENRYASFHSCLKAPFCTRTSDYLIDTVNKQIAITAIYPADYFSKEKDEDGRPIYDYDHDYKFLFLSPDASEEFIQKSLEFFESKKHQTRRQAEIFVADCQKSNEMVKLSTHQ